MKTKILCAIIAGWILVTKPILANDLAIGKSAKINGPIDISINPPAEFNFKPRAEIFRLRAQEVMRHSQLLTDQYIPANDVFGKYKTRRDGGDFMDKAIMARQNSINGPAEESRFILNPFLLVGEAIICGVEKSKCSESDFINSKFPMFYPPSNLRWWPKEGKAEVTYGVTAYKNQMASLLGFSTFNVSNRIALEAINARDLGLKYFYIPPSWVHNVNVASPMSKPMPVHQFVHCSGNCGYPGGCNNMGPRCEELDNFTFTQLPASISIMFWKAPPTTGSEKPDMVYTINYQ